MDKKLIVVISLLVGILIASAVYVPVYFMHIKPNCKEDVKTLSQTNQKYIGTEMASMCDPNRNPVENAFPEKSPQVKCAVALNQFENELGRPLFDTDYGLNNDLDQSRWCLGMPTTTKKNFEDAVASRYIASYNGSSVSNCQQTFVATDAANKANCA